MAEDTRVFTDAKKGSPSGCKKLGKHGSRKRAVRRWALENKEAQQGSHSIYRRRYAWNEKNLLKESSDSRYTVYYRYGADGQRAVKSSEQSETLYFNTMWSWIHNSSAYNTDREIKHIYLGSERLVTRTNGAGSAGHTSTAEASTYYYHSDHLGSAHLITDYKGDEYERIEYTPYGEYWIEKRASENRTLPFKFTGKERDEETGLYYYGARYLDAKTSRWLTTDPALGDYIPMAPVNDEAKKHNQNLPGMGGIYNTVNFHLYHYAGNNPVKYIDPDGRNIAFGVDKYGAGGNGHTSLYFQDKEGGWYKFDQYTTRGASGNNPLTQFLSYTSKSYEGGVSIQKIDKLPKGLKEIKTTEAQDEKIFTSAFESANQHITGKKKYHLFANNCTDAAVDVVNNADTGFKVKNSWYTVRPNAWIKKYNTWYEKNKDMTSKDKPQVDAISGAAPKVEGE